MNKFAIYTAIVGKYDNILQPLVTGEGFDFILFSNDIKDKQIGVWKVRSIPYHNDIQTKVARWVKTHPEDLLSEYEYTIWMDANIQINDSFVYNRIIQLTESQSLISSMWHHERDCIYEEAIELLSRGMEHERIVYKWISQLKKRHYIHHNGLCETNVLFRANQSSSIHELDSLWWEIIDSFSKRDQLSFNYLLWRKKMACPYFLTKGENTRNSSHFNYNYHNITPPVIQPNKFDDPFIYYYSANHTQPSYHLLKKLHKILFCLPFSFWHLKLIGVIYRVKRKICK